MAMNAINELLRLASPEVTPQALAWHDDALWMGSRDRRRVYGINTKTWNVFEEIEVPGIPWAAVPTGEVLCFTIGEGADDDRYLYRYLPNQRFSKDDKIPCPELTGSYLSFDGEHIYLSQWYKHRILKLDASGAILEAFDIGAEISGHTFVEGLIYVMRGTEQGTEDWRIARFDPGLGKPPIEDLAHVPFACRSLAFDGASFWTNHRAANEIVSFALP